MTDGFEVVVSDWLPRDMIAMVTRDGEPVHLTAEQRAAMEVMAPEDRFVEFGRILGGRGRIVVARNVGERWGLPCADLPVVKL